MVMESYDSATFRNCINAADLITPDGIPLVWVLHRPEARHAPRVYGPDLTSHLLKAAEDAGVLVGFFGGMLEFLDALLKLVGKTYSRLKVAYSLRAAVPPLKPGRKQRPSRTHKRVQGAFTLCRIRLSKTRDVDGRQFRRWASSDGRRGASFDFLGQSVVRPPRGRRQQDWSGRFDSCRSHAAYEAIFKAQPVLPSPRFCSAESSGTPSGLTPQAKQIQKN